VGQEKTRVGGGENKGEDEKETVSINEKNVSPRLTSLIECLAYDNSKCCNREGVRGEGTEGDNERPRRWALTRSTTKTKMFQKNVAPPSFSAFSAFELWTGTTLFLCFLSLFTP
jgi:hypothetical protein